VTALLKAQKAKAAALQNHSGNRGLQRVGETGFEPATPWSRNSEGLFTPVSMGSQNVQLLANIEGTPSTTSHRFTENAPDPKFFATRLLRQNSGPNLRQNELLRVTDVARLLRLSRATIYRLVDRGELPALRIGNTIRFHPHKSAKAVVQQFAATQTRSAAMQLSSRVHKPRQRGAVRFEALLRDLRFDGLLWDGQGLRSARINEHFVALTVLGFH